MPTNIQLAALHHARTQHRRYATSGGGEFNPANLQADGEYLAMLYALNGSSPYYHASGLSGVQYLDSKERYGSYRAPRQGRCWLFDGTDDYGYVLSSVLSGTTFTICGWATPHAALSSYAVMAVSGNDKVGVMLKRSVSGSALVGYVTTSSGLFFVSSGVVLSVGDPRHISLTWDGALLAIYVDGALRATTPTTGTIAYDSWLTIGAARSTSPPGAPVSSTPASAKLRDIRLYSVAKDATAIANIYAGGTDLTGLLAQYPCNEESGTVGYDSSGNGNHLTLTNITEGTFHATDSGVTSNPANAVGYTLSGSVIVPRDESDPTLDVLGGSLQYTGRCPYPVRVDTPCITNSGGTVYLSAPHLSGSETVVSFAGSTTTPTISAGRIDWASGTTLASLVLSDGTNYPCQEGPGSSNTNRTIYDVSGDGNHATLVNSTVANIWAARLSGTVKDWCVEYGGDIGAAGEFVPGQISGTLAADGTPKTLSAGKVGGNPFSRRNNNPFTAAEFNGRSIGTSIAGGDAAAGTPSDSSFHRVAADGDDRILVFTDALTGSNLTSVEDHTT